MSAELIIQIKSDLKRIDYLFETYADLFEIVKMKDPDLIQTAAITSVIYGFIIELKTSY